MTTAMAALIEARRRAHIAAKAALRAQGLKLARVERKALVALAEEHLATHRAELIAEATERVPRWQTCAALRSLNKARNVDQPKEFLFKSLVHNRRRTCRSKSVPR
jgi:hypothetical protein